MRGSLIDTQVTVECGSRLHLGFTNLSGELGRRYGSIGVGLDGPRTVVRVEPWDGLLVEGRGRDQILRYVEKFLAVNRVPRELRLVVEERAPEHCGLGSGTRLALAIGEALARFYGVDPDPLRLARELGRGRRSGIGILTYTLGGFVVDAGHRADGTDHRPQALFQADFPEDWRFVVAIPEAEEGLSGPQEEGVFRVLTPPPALSERASSLTLLRLLPALLDQDIAEFGTALTALDRNMGAFFGEAQGGVHGQSAGSVVIERMLEAGAEGAGQSSWGPAVYGLTDRARTDRVVEAVRRVMAERGFRGVVTVARGRNRGATARVGAGGWGRVTGPAAAAPLPTGTGIWGRLC